MTKKSILLLSGGLDSTVASALSLRHAKPLLAITADYGQKAFEPERITAGYFAKLWGCEHRTVDLKWLGKLTPPILTKYIDPSSPITLDDEPSIIASAKDAWVPARNLLLVAVAASHADALGADMIVTGWNGEEAATFPDNSTIFATALNRTLKSCCFRPLELFLPLLGWDKTEIYAQGMQLKLDMERIYPCWEAGPKACGKCESCLRFQRARRNNLPRKV